MIFFHRAVLTDGDGVADNIVEFVFISNFHYSHIVTVTNRAYYMPLLDKTHLILLFYKFLFLELFHSCFNMHDITSSVKF